MEEMDLREVMSTEKLMGMIDEIKNSFVEGGMEFE